MGYELETPRHAGAVCSSRSELDALFFVAPSRSAHADAPGARTHRVSEDAGAA
jgi:hypothetical protein